MSEMKIPDSLHDLMYQLLGGRGVRDSRTKEVIEFDLKPNQNQYIYWENEGWMFCYTPWKATNGKYYCWTYRPVGEGSRTGNPSRWKMEGLVACSTRKLAKKKAYNRLVKHSNRRSRK
jgi:hypothetical protein